jgi:linoleoyl-CoA desaturase
MQGLRLTRNDDFTKKLTENVNDYFKSKNLSRHGSWKILLKVPILLSVYFLPYILMMTGVIQSTGWMWLMSVVMGLGMAGIGLAIMHDANHGTFSKNERLNTLMCYTLEMLGGYHTNWKIQHNVLHHSFTNVHDMDEDIDPIGLLRFSPNAPLKKIHRFQVFYAWFFYGLMTFSWMTNKDIKQIIDYNKRGLLKSQNKTLAKALRQIIISKIIYYSYVLVLPLILLDQSWWQILIGLGTIHFVCGIVLAFVFQSAHVVSDTEFINEDNFKELNEETSWAKHQMMTTANFSNWNPLFTWYLGGLNHQIEHHLFPDISHVHYRRISKIVRKTAKEYGVPYHYHKTFGGAILNHLVLLNRLGKPNVA